MDPEQPWLVTTRTKEHSAGKTTSTNPAEKGLCAPMCFFSVMTRAMTRAMTRDVTRAFGRRPSV